MNKIISIMAALLLLGGVYAFTTVLSWKVSKKHQITFSGKGVSGVFKSFTSDIQFDPNDIEHSSLSITLDVKSLDAGIPLQTDHAIGKDWFDAEKFPSIKFNSSSIVKATTGYMAKGKMEVKGQTKEMELPFDFVGTKKKGNFTSSFVIKRSDFHVGEPMKEVSDEIKVNVVIPVKK
jgi:polyisoprenoid-binding protein YceI